MFIVTLDAYWFRENHIEKVQQEDNRKDGGVGVILDYNGGYDSRGNTKGYVIMYDGTYNGLTNYYLVRDGYTFEGWHYSNMYVYDGLPLISNSEHTIFAAWKLDSASSSGSSSGVSTTSITVTLDYND